MVQRLQTTLLCFIFSLVLTSLGMAAQHEPPSAGPGLTGLLDMDLGRLYLRAKMDQKFKHARQLDRLELMYQRYLSGVQREVERRSDATLASAVYDAFISSACPAGILSPGYIKIAQNGSELSIRQNATLLRGVVVRNSVVVVMPPQQELVGTIFEGGIDLIAASGACSMSFVKAVNLHEAVRFGNIEAVRSIIAAGANVDEPAVWGTPLDIAVAKGSNAIAELLIEAGADVEGATADSVGRQHPLHLVATRLSGASMAQLLINGGAKLDARDKAGKTPLIRAVSAGNIEVADVLLKAGADIEKGDTELGASPLSWAACSDQVRAVEFLLSKGAQINRQAGPDGDTPLHRAVVCCLKTPDMINLLVAKGADVNALNNNGVTPIKQSYSKRQRDLLVSLGASE